MKILLVGSGGRESALAWKMAQSPQVEAVIVSPGNPGMRRLSHKIDLMKDVAWESYVALKPDLVVIGPEAPLMDGIADYLESHDLKVVGPSKAGALLEGSKVFCKEILTKAGAPTAPYFVATNMNEVKAGLENWKSEGVVVKVDGLAQGKGVIVASTKEEAITAAQDFFSGSYLGFKADRLLLEERLLGEEVSCFALCDGENFIFLGSATDYKRLNNLDQGPNTGGMGTISPSPVLTSSDEAWISANVFAPTLKVMSERGTPFKGFLFAGIMKTAKGLEVLEYNTRLGDPETQSLLPRIKEDIVPYLFAASCGELGLLQRPELSGSCLHIVMAAKGYPGVKGETIQRGDSIHIQNLNSDTLFFPAGVAGDDKELLTNGGRVCGISARGTDLNLAREKAYQEIKKIQFYGAHFRTDIGAKFL